MEITQNIENLLQRNASDLEISKEIRSSVQNYFQNLDKVFEKYQGKDFLVKHTRYIDALITTIYRIAVRKMFGIYSPLSNAIPITLVALGSYGREQMAPYSDIDLMIVYDDAPGYNIQAIIEKMLYIIWDTKLKLGHRVHHINELLDVSRKDITIKTAILESRFIVGSKYLWFQIERVLRQIRKDNLQSFIFEKIEEAKKRREKYPLSMQPDIKEGVGGLRDSHLLFWIANAIYDIRTLKDLEGTLFSQEEYKEFRIALEWLFRVRNALHIVAGKKQDRLVFQYIPDIAKKLDIKGKNATKKQQNLVTKTFQAMHTIDTFSQIFVKKMIRPYLFDAKNIEKLRHHRCYPKTFLCEEKLYCSFFHASYPLSELLELLSSCSFHAYDPSAIYYAKSAKSAKTLTAKSSKIIKTLFYKKDLAAILNLLYDANLLHIVIPPLKRVLFMPQFDGYHQYPVDIHSIACVKALENIKDPHVLALYEDLDPDEKAMLKLTTLLHDSGKGRRQRHHEVGAKLLRAYAQKLGFNEKLIDLGALLIRHHTSMSDTAYNKDIHNEKVVYSFLAPLKSKKALDMLYILTYADINGVGRGLYNSYNAKLLNDLYMLSLEALENREILDETAKRVRKERALKKHPLFRKLSPREQRKILSIESNLFFIKHKIEEIIKISQKAFATKFFSYSFANDDFFTIEIIRKVPLNLGYLLGKLSFLDIRSMEVFKLFDDMKYFKIEFSQKIEEANFPSIQRVIEDSFDMSKKIELQKPIIKKEDIYVDCNHSKTYAMMQINAKNQKGFLAYIAKVFDDYGIDIATAKLNTVRNRINDLFLIEKNGRFCASLPEIIMKLTGE